MKQSVRLQLPTLCTSINWRWEWVLSKQSFVVFFIIIVIIIIIIIVIVIIVVVAIIFFSLCLLSGKGYRSSETVSLIHLFLSEERSLNIWHTPLVNLKEYNPQPPTGRKRSYLQIQTFCQIYSKKILSWFPARISSLAAWLPLANHFHAWRRFHTSKWPTRSLFWVDDHRFSNSYRLGLLISF